MQALWEAFGVRAWHPDDLAAIDAETLDLMVASIRERHGTEG